MGPWIVVALALGAAPAPGEDDFLLSFVLGEYSIVGRGPDDGVAYSGSARVEHAGGGFVLKRQLNGREIIAAGKLEVPSPPGEGQVLRFRWHDGAPMVMSCLVDGDLDNYPRLTCLWGREDAQPGEAGLEAMFPKK